MQVLTCLTSYVSPNLGIQIVFALSARPFVRPPVQFFSVHNLTNSLSQTLHTSWDDWYVLLKEKTLIVFEISASEVKFTGIKQVKFVSAQYLANCSFQSCCFYRMICLIECKSPIKFGASGLKVKVTGIKNVKLLSIQYLTNRVSTRHHLSSDDWSA